jgi:hypothetical protein
MIRQGVKGKRQAGESKRMLPVVRKLDKQMTLEPYDKTSIGIDGTVEDYVELTIAFGYLIFFGVCAPIVGCFTAVALLIEICVDVTKLNKLVRRPHPNPALDIGVWETIFSAMTWLAVFVNAGLLSYTRSFNAKADFKDTRRPEVPVDDSEDGLFESRSPLIMFLIYVSILLTCKIGAHLWQRSSTAGTSGGDSEEGRLGFLDTAERRLRFVLDKVKRRVEADKTPQQLEFATAATYRYQDAGHERKL